MEGGGPDAVGQQVVGELVYGELGIQEHDHPAVAGRDLGGRTVLVSAVHVQHVVLHRGDRAGGRVDGVDDRVGEVPAAQEVDVAVEGGGEQHPLALGTHLGSGVR